MIKNKSCIETPPTSYQMSVGNFYKMAVPTIVVICDTLTILERFCFDFTIEKQTILQLIGINHFLLYPCVTPANTSNLIQNPKPLFRL